MLNGKAIIAATVGGMSGALMAYFVKIPVVGLISFPLGGAIAVICYGPVLRQRISLRAGAVLGMLAGFVMAVLVAIITIVMTGVRTIEFAASVMLFPVLISVLSILGGWGTALFLRSNVPTAGD